MLLSIRASCPDPSIGKAMNLIRVNWMPEWGRSPSYATVRRWAGRQAERATTRGSADPDLVPLNDWTCK